MRRNLIAAFVLGTTLILAGCKDDETPPKIDNETPGAREFISLTASIPDEAGVAGNGGTMAYAITHEQAIDPGFSVDIYKDGFGLRSARTARCRLQRTEPNCIISSIREKTAACSTNTS